MFLLVIVSTLLCGIPGDSTPAESLRVGSQRHISKRVVGGSPIEIDTFPWIASIMTNSIQICSGSVLSDTMILTAAHCTSQLLLKSLSVRVGSSRLSEGGSVHSCVRVVSHEDFADSRSHILNDVALMTVDPPITLRANVAKVSLPSKGYVAEPGTVVSVAGWGRTSENGPGSRWLMSTDLFVMSSARCAIYYGDASGTWMDSHGQICTDATSKDACKGDSGGPLMVGGMQVGIISWSRGCARPDYPGVCVDLAVYRDWIDEKMGRAVSNDAGFFETVFNALSEYWPVGLW